MRDSHDRNYNYSPQYRFPPSYSPSAHHQPISPSLSSSSPNPSHLAPSRGSYRPSHYDGSPSQSPSPSPPSSPFPSSQSGFSPSSKPQNNPSPHTPYQHNTEFSRTPFHLPERPPIEKKRQLKDIHQFERSLRERYRHAIKIRNRYFCFILLLIVVDVVFALSLCLVTPPPFWDPLFWQNESHLNTWVPLVVCIFFTGMCIVQGYRGEYIRGPSLFISRCNYYLENLNIRFSEKDCKLVIRNRG